MGLFVCDECGCVENTALAGSAGYWTRGIGDGKARCSSCNPEVGKWHGRFVRQQWDGVREVINRDSKVVRFHVRDGVYFYRADASGAVVIDSPGLLFQMTAGEWASVVAAVSRRGETGETFRSALDFHQEGSG